MKLSPAEEQLMESIWKLKKSFMKEIIDELPEPKPASTTISTMLKRMTEKGFIGYIEYGKSRQYYALIDKEKYFSKQVQGLIKNFFGNSALQFASFFAKETPMTASELEELKTIIDEELKKSKP
ncbi:BlaI/MecI/CopY family transcriptional regulator [Flavobacterium sp. HSC-61S13]|uniref:BlaI/MecI/CopY family transcriptional regulator n=1 Tax=Flavobacterium sp. HSC-61S13 TaxID=2910963 RepID=UPI0020A10027|nr:BlaI/MecI/CopY family transcriptional regulator [Flavobacterium sp. HSC-61S13]MCP1995374.1 putative transcriptional regulator [Flavobacterium sp. HSC-61S13]